MWLCRDVLFHLPTKDVLKVIENFKKSSIEYLLTTNFYFQSKNLDIKPGGFRFLNLHLKPYNLPKPLANITDFVISSKVSLSLSQSQFERFFEMKYASLIATQIINPGFHLLLAIILLNQYSDVIYAEFVVQYALLMGLAAIVQRSKWQHVHYYLWAIRKIR